MSEDWRPSASLEVLKARAELYGSVRAFFRERGVWEVDTPVLSAHATVDRHIESFEVAAGGWLQTSPEFAMKRLLCAGSGPIFQIAPVFRREEQGRHHNPEFRLLEWYRPGWDHHQLMSEVESLIRTLICGDDRPFERLSYRQAFEREAGVDPFAINDSELAAAVRAQGIECPEGMVPERDTWLDLLMAHCVGPGLGRQQPEFVYDFPASQAALSRIRPGDPPVAERFELFWQGVELANGFHELGDAEEQQQRFEADLEFRRSAGQSMPPFDRYLIEALSQGLPDCAGVALGLDRLLMLKQKLPTLTSTLAFAFDRA